jgi:ABC-type phosphate/phosphonate transport system permease subunit
MLQTFFQAMLIFVMFTAGIAFKFATLETPRVKGEKTSDALRRLWTTYRTRCQYLIAAPWIWGLAGAWTALCLALYLTSRSGA